MMVRSTHTVVELPLSSAAYREIADALRAAGYGHAFIGNGMIDMTGIGVTEKPLAQEPFTFLVHIIGDGLHARAIPVDLMAHVDARERGESLRDFTLKRQNAHPYATTDKDSATLETAITMAETLAILDVLRIHRKATP